MHRILVVDDEISMLKGIEFNLMENPDYELLTASDKNLALELLEATEIDLVVSDLMLPDMSDGLEIMKTAKSQWYKPSVIAMTAHQSIDNAVNAMKAGADDFLSKGFGIEELSIRIGNILSKKKQIDQLSVENKILKEAIQQHYNDFKIIGRSKQMVQLINKIRKVADDAKATCLLEGESGTGKDLIARSIHSLSNRRNFPFIPINCAAIPENLIESELFGHEKGAFTGAHTAKQGKFEQAKGGIIFLDEIGELPLALQVRLLRVLEERNFYRVGGNRSINIDVMIIAATNQNLLTRVKEEKFREDLYFRLNVINIWVPPLREHKEDIRPLAFFFLDRFNNERKKDLKLSESALEHLESYDFPGNVRELRNILEDAFVFCDNEWIHPQNLSLRQPQAHHNNSDLTPNSEEFKNVYELPHKEALKQFESQYFLRLLKENYWNVNATAKKAEISREWLSKKVKILSLKSM